MSLQYTERLIDSRVSALQSTDLDNSAKEAAFNDITNEYQERLKRYAQAIYGNLQDAEDAVQDALLGFWEGVSTYDSQRLPVSLWLSRLTRNKILDRYKKESGQLKKMKRAARLGSAVIKDTRIDADFDPAAIYERTEAIAEAEPRARKILEAMLNQPPRTREALGLRVQGYTDREAAERMGVRIGTFKRLNFQGRKAIERELETPSEV